MKHRQIILFITSLLLITGFFLLPQNKKWLNEKLLAYWNDFRQQKNDLDIEKRKIKRYGTSYTFSKRIAAFFEKNGTKEKVLLLLPSQQYFQRHGIRYEVPEPAVFYYFTGLKTTWANSSKASEANWIIRVENRNLIIDSVADKTVLLDSIASYRKFRYPL